MDIEKYILMQCFQLHLSEAKMFNFVCSYEHFTISSSSGVELLKMNPGKHR